MSIKDPENALYEYLEKTSVQETPQHLKSLVSNLVNSAENPEGIAAILLYGSGLWQGEDKDTIWDLYILLDGFKDLSPHAGLRLAGHLIPPNVYYTDEPKRCKYTVMRLDQFENAVSKKAWKPQIWARFSQPCHIIYARNNSDLKRILNAFKTAVLTFHEHALAFANDTTTPHSIWVSGLKQTYASEFRSEGNERIQKLYKASETELKKRSELALACLPDFSQNALKRRKFKILFWRPFVKFLYFIQLMKATFSFQNGVEYALWKIERHSGQKFEASNFQKKYPLIGGWPLMFKIYKSGALK